MAKTAKQILGNEILEGLKTYARNRDNQAQKKWDKEKDLDAIFDLWMKGGKGRSIEASAGSFFFSQKGERLIYCTASTKPSPRLIPNLANGKPNGNAIWRKL